MNQTKLKGMILIVLMAAAGLAGCIGDDDDDDGGSSTTVVVTDGGYTYASNVDNHRALMADLCDIKTAASAYDWATAKDIYENGKNAEKSDGSYRTLAGFAAADGKNHGYDAFYGQSGSIGAHITAALDGTGDFAGTSDTVRYQGVAKLTANMGMIGYTIHELNTAVGKANEGNVDNDSGAPHNWDEGWAFFHGPDENLGCAPANTFKKRSADFGTETDGVSNTLSAVETAMIDGLAALQAEDQAGYTAATNTVVKNVIITYTQATMKYTYKMDDADNGPKYQAEGYAFWKVIEAYVADYTDACYNSKTHTMSYIGAGQASNCDGFQYYENQAMPDGTTFTGCYNMETHTMANMETGPMGDEMNETNCNEGFSADMYYDNYGAGEINEIVNLQDATKLGTSYDIAPYMQMVLHHYGITAAELGTYA
tara:strand:- start:1295 stop:2572 length:1278 start_codon:yes stop_codon:yes gene_type:complete